MEPLRHIAGVACPIALANVDTDQILPARFLQRPRSEGHGPVLFHDMRFDAAGKPRPEFPLNRPAWTGARILVARRNFGAGSSRESAVYALVDYGVRCVIAPSFGDIFAANAVNNGLLPARVSEAAADELIAALEHGAEEVAIDLEAQSIRTGNHVVAFEIDPVWRMKLLNGWNDLDLTLSYSRDISAFVAADARLRPWAQPPTDLPSGGN
jgi:3-isopropylmalate/(R)-2-methylmalate dehydratase small subunit